MRVLHVITGLTTGGAESVLFRLTTFPSNVEHEVVCLEDRAWFSDKLEANGIRVHHLVSRSGASTLPAFLRLRRLVRESNADVIQAWMYRSNLLAGIAGKLAGIPVVWNIRCSSLDTLRRSTRFLARAGGVLARWVPACVINCSAASAELHARMGYDGADGVVIPNGCDPEEFRPDEEARKRTREQLGIAPDTFLVGNIGRWHPQKGFPVFLHALALARHRGVAMRVLIVGRGLDADNDALARLINAEGVGDMVQLLGERADIPDLSRAFDVHVLSSVGAEGFPNVVAETMLSATPNIATDVGESALILGKTGWLVPANEPLAIATALEEAFAEWRSAPERWQERRRSARDRIRDNFSLERMADAYQTVWRKVAAARA